MAIRFVLIKKNILLSNCRKLRACQGLVRLSQAGLDWVKLVWVRVRLDWVTVGWVRVGMDWAKLGWVRLGRVRVRLEWVGLVWVRAGWFGSDWVGLGSGWNSLD